MFTEIAVATFFLLAIIAIWLWINTPTEDDF